MKYCWILYNQFWDNHLKWKIWVGWVDEERGIYPWPIELCDNFRDDSKWRKELLRERSRILNDLKGPETEIRKEDYDWNYTLLKNVGKWG